MRGGTLALLLSLLPPAAALLLSPVRISRAPVVAADARRCNVVAKYFAPLETPAAYQELLAGASNESISVIKYVSASCRTCRAAEPKLDAFAKRWPGASFHSLVLLKNGKMPGKRNGLEPSDRDPDSRLTLTTAVTATPSPTSTFTLTRQADERLLQAAQRHRAPLCRGLRGADQGRRARHVPGAQLPGASGK